MLRCIVRLYERAQRAITDTSSEAAGDKFSWRVFAATNPKVIEDLVQMKFESPTQEDAVLREKFDAIAASIDDTFDSMF